MTSRLEKGESVSNIVGKILFELEAIRDSGRGKSLLANLRNSVGQPLSETISSWSFLYERFPKEWIENSNKISNEETVVLTILQLYAIHQQAITSNVHISSKANSYQNIGNSLGFLRKGENTLAIDRRFNAMVTSHSFEELIHHLRQLIKLYKSKEKEKSKIDYSRLAQDLFWFRCGSKEWVRLSWARAYYASQEKGEDNNDK